MGAECGSQGSPSAPTTEDDLFNGVNHQPIHRPPKAQVDDLILTNPVTDEISPNDNEFKDTGSLDDKVYQRDPLPILLDRIYSRVWARERERRIGNRPAGNALWSRTGKLALKMDGRYLKQEWDTVNKIMHSQRGLTWLLNLGILQDEPPGWIKFCSELTKTYFAASRLQHIARSPLWAQCTDDFKQRVCQILAELQPDSPFCKNGGS